LNLFVTDVDPRFAAQHLDDKRLGSALREACQMLSVAIKFWDKNFDELEHCGHGMVTWGSAYVNHPVTIWVRETRDNWTWTVEYAHYVADEYEHRFDKEHAAALRVSYITQFRHCLPAGGLLPFQNSARNEGRNLDFTYLPVPYSYHQYLIARWKGDVRPVKFTNRGAPAWSLLTQ